MDLKGARRWIVEEDEGRAFLRLAITFAFVAIFAIVLATR